MTLLDTHVLVWLRVGNPRLGKRARAAIDRALRSDEIAVSAVSFWELEMLSRRHRIDLPCPAGEWRGILMREGLVEIPLDGEVAVRAAGLRSFHRDPVDRFIVATALAGHQLVTADQRILEWPENLDRLDATR